MRKFSLDYLAGIFDGEGYFTIRSSSPTNKKMGKRPKRLQAVVSVTITEKYICDAFMKEFGGSVKIHNKNTRGKNHNFYYIWNLTGPGIINFCTKMGSLLTIKKERNSLIKEFQELKTSIGNRPISDEQYDKSINLYSKFRKLNKRGVNL